MPGAVSGRSGGALGVEGDFAELLAAGMRPSSITHTLGDLESTILFDAFYFPPLFHVVFFSSSGLIIFIIVLFSCTNWKLHTLFLSLFFHFSGYPGNCHMHIYQGQKLVNYFTFLFSNAKS